MSFEDLGLSPALLKAVERAGYTEPTPIQIDAIPTIIQGRDVIGYAQTGTGKTAAFAMPVLHRLSGADSGQADDTADQQASDPSCVSTTLASESAESLPPTDRPRCLVLAPTRELAAQVSESFRIYGKQTQLRVAPIYGGVGKQAQIDALQAGVEIIVATPGRILDLHRQGHAKLDAVEILVVDECDEMLNMGFLPDVRTIIAELPKQRQSLFFAATMPAEIRELGMQYLDSPARIWIPRDEEVAGLVNQSFYYTDESAKARLLAQFLHTMPFGPALVFTKTKHGADGVVKKLRKLDIRAEALHSRKSQTKRRVTLSNFRAGHTNVLVATDIAARGIDIERIFYVFNYDVPAVVDTYVHRIGRTGRAGNAGMAVTLCSDRDRHFLHAIERRLRLRFPMGPKIPPMPNHVKGASDEVKTSRPQNALQRPKGKFKGGKRKRK